MKFGNQRLHLTQPATYRIEVQGRLDEKWSAHFDDMALTVKSGGDGPTITTLTGTISDQAALHGILVRIRDLGLPLLLVQYLKYGETYDDCPPVSSK